MNALLVGIRLAVIAIVRNRLRASLTVLGILIGVASVVTVTALGTGARESVGSQIESMGSNVIMVVPQSAAASGAKGALGAAPRLTEEDGRAILNEAVSVAAVAPMLRSKAFVVVGEKNTLTQVIGTTRAFHVVRNWKVNQGTQWEEHDELTKTRVCLLGTTVVKNLFPNGEDPVGRIVRIGRYAYTVKGVLETKGEAPFGGDQDDMIAMPISSMRARIIRTPPGSAGVLNISATSAETTERAVAQIDAILRQRHRIAEGFTPDFWIRTQKEFQQMQTAIYTVLTLLLIAIAGVSLIVGGIGVMNIMLVSVTERTREIGIRMAIGAREGDIRAQFLVEAIVLALFGGLLGSVIGIAATAALGALLEWPMKVSTPALILSVATSAATGIVFGFFPARNAAKLDPIVALRHE